jgi:hypothetical protein
VASLPPYRAPRSQGLVWLLRTEGWAAALAGIGDTVSDCWFDDDGVAAAAPAALPGVALHQLDGDLDATVRAIKEGVASSGGSAVVIAAEPALQQVLRGLLDLPAIGGRFRFIPGAPSSIQLLPDRTVLRHLNQAAALT